MPKFCKIYKRCSTGHLFSLIFTCEFNATQQVTFYMCSENDVNSIMTYYCGSADAVSPQRVSIHL